MIVGYIQTERYVCKNGLTIKSTVAPERMRSGHTEGACPEQGNAQAARPGKPQTSYDEVSAAANCKSRHAFAFSCGLRSR